MNTGKPKAVCSLFWYRREQWDRWKELSDDWETMHDSFDEWEAAASQKVEELARIPVEVHKVEVDLDEFLKWIEDNGLKNNGQNRAQFANEKLQKQLEPPTPINADNSEPPRD